jgi:membrane protease YdiL (CAAX protease family)
VLYDAVPEMNANSKKGVGYPSQAGTLAAETAPAKSLERGEVALKKRRARLSSTLEGSATLTYADVGLFFVSVFVLAVIFRIGVHLHVLSQTALDNPSLSFQIAISLFLIGSLYAIVRLRHGRKAWILLGWSWPDRIHLIAALVGGIGLGIVVDIVARATTPSTHVVHLWNLMLLDASLGPVIEESFFRGCLLPVVARATGPFIAILVTAVLFATLHPIRSFVQWLCFLITGTAYGWIRVKSGSTAASTLMHTVYNATLFFCQAL